MDFTKTNLRNNNNPLLRRIERQLEKKENERIFEDLKLKKNKVKKFNEFSVEGFLDEDELFEQEVFKPRKETRLKLFENRRGCR